MTVSLRGTKCGEARHAERAAHGRSLPVLMARPRGYMLEGVHVSTILRENDFPSSNPCLSFRNVHDFRNRRNPNILGFTVRFPIYRCSLYGFLKDFQYTRIPYRDLLRNMLCIDTCQMLTGDEL